MRLIRSHVAGSEPMVCRAQEVISHPQPAWLCLLGTLQVCALLAIEALCCGLVPGPRGQGLVLGMLRLGGSLEGLLAVRCCVETWCFRWPNTTARSLVSVTLRSHPAPHTNGFMQHGQGMWKGSFPSRVCLEHPKSLIQSKVKVHWRSGIPK